MVGNRVVLVAALMGCVGCKSKPTAEPTVPPSASPAESPSVAPDKVTADVRDDDRGLFAVIEVHVGGALHTLELTSDFEDCEGSEATVEEVALNDDRLRMVQLFCENGEDVFTRRMITALLLADATPRFLWQGSGSFTNEFDTCSRIDVLSFRRASSGQVEAVRTVEVSVGDGGEENDECVASPSKDTVIETIDVPGTAVPPAAKRAEPSK